MAVKVSLDFHPESNSYSLHTIKETKTKSKNYTDTTISETTISNLKIEDVEYSFCHEYGTNYVCSVTLQFESPIEDKEIRDFFGVDRLSY